MKIDCILKKKLFNYGIIVNKRLFPLKYISGKTVYFTEYSVLTDYSEIYFYSKKLTDFTDYTEYGKYNSPHSVDTNLFVHSDHRNKCPVNICFSTKCT